jgi:hypothetical protein
MACLFSAMCVAPKLGHETNHTGGWLPRVAGYPRSQATTYSVALGLEGRMVCISVAAELCQERQNLEHEQY